MFTSTVSNSGSSRGKACCPTASTVDSTPTKSSATAWCDAVQTLLEVVTLPVSDPDASIRFYRDAVGFTLDVDYSPTPNFRVVQLTPPGSSTSIQFGSVGPHAPLCGLYLVVADVAAFRDELIGRGVLVGGLRHKEAADGWRGSFLPGVDADRADYASFADFSDPDGNRWVLQERGHVNPGRFQP
ncbi:VOC family protein [Mycolicibacterium moriokaense]|nr:VOC family protein [Mycolicibacterium moriokaense]